MWPPLGKNKPPDPFGEAVEQYAHGKAAASDTDHRERLARAMRAAIAAAATGFHAVAAAATAAQGLPDLLQADPAALISPVGLAAASAASPRRPPAPRRGVALAAAAVGMPLPSVAEVESLYGGSTQPSPTPSPRARAASPATPWPVLDPAGDADAQKANARDKAFAAGQQHRRSDHDAGQPVPIVFLHGVGVGILPYLPFIARLAASFSGRPVLVLEVPRLPTLIAARPMLLRWALVQPDTF